MFFHKRECCGHRSLVLNAMTPSSVFPFLPQVDSLTGFTQRAIFENADFDSFSFGGHFLLAVAVWMQLCSPVHETH